MFQIKRNKNDIISYIIKVVVRGVARAQRILFIAMTERTPFLLALQTPLIKVML